jgi:DNA polymerase
MIGMNRSEVFIANVIKCRPPGNRDPLPSEVDTCTETYLFRQIDLIDPRIIVTLGRYSMGLFFPKAKITAIHGQPKREGARIYLPIFHPAAVLRNIALKPQAEADFKKIPALLEEARKMERTPSFGRIENPPS